MTTYLKKYHQNEKAQLPRNSWYFGNFTQLWKISSFVHSLQGCLLCHLVPYTYAFISPIITHLPISERGKFVKAGVTATQWVHAFWLKWNEMQHFFKSQLFPTCSIRVKHAKWACNILTFVPCGIWGHKCIAYHNTHLHNSCKSGPLPGEHIWPIHNSGWQGDRLPGVMGAGLSCPLHFCTHDWTCCMHPTWPWVRKPLHLHLNRWQIIRCSRCHSPQEGNRTPNRISPGREITRGTLVKPSRITWDWETDLHLNLSAVTYSLVVRLWASYSTSATLSFPPSKNGADNAYFIGLLWWLSNEIYTKLLIQYVTHCKHLRNSIHFCYGFFFFFTDINNLVEFNCCGTMFSMRHFTISAVCIM